MKNIKLSTTGSRAPVSLNKEKTKEKLHDLKIQLGKYQNLLFAEGKHSLLIILQGMDASGKDGAIQNVFHSVNPMGCRVIAFKTPSEIENKHDFLWRIHLQAPEKGMIHIFNRSHYEDVTIQKVHNTITKEVIKQRYNHINNFEKLLTESGTIVLKFYLHISKDKQYERLQERINDPEKMWKHNEQDMKEREKWNDYMKAYQDAFEYCSDYAPWYIIPADQNWYKEYLIAKITVNALKKLRMKFPAI
jgi:PPK2 family polyphosphate:nucleotide phosphotransferase